MWGLAAALKLNPAKCVVIPLGGATVESVRRTIAEVACEFAHCKVAVAGKYLGLFIGAGADEVQWVDLPARMRERIAQIRVQRSGMVFSMLMFRVYVSSLLQYKARFLSPCVALCKAYVKCEQRILACPWSAVPEQVLHNWKCIGMRVGLPHLESLAMAAQVRLVASLPCFWDLHSQACSVLDSDDCILRFLGGGWHLGVSLVRLAATWRAARPIRGVIEALASEKPKAVQRLAYVALRGELSMAHLKKKFDEWLTKLFVRAGSFGMAVLLIEELGSKSQLAPLAVRAPVTKTFCNAWITSSRMHGAAEGCRFGCGSDGSDSMKHYLNCAVVLT